MAYPIAPAATSSATMVRSADQRNSVLATEPPQDSQLRLRSAVARAEAETSAWARGVADIACRTQGPRAMSSDRHSWGVRAFIIVTLCLASAASAQVYRCGNKYSNTSCPGGREVDASPQVSQQGKNAAAITLYLCQSYGGGKFWTREHCVQHNALLIEWNLSRQAYRSSSKWSWPKPSATKAKF